MKRTLDTLCQQIALGRQLTRELNVALQGQKLKESEFRLLWLLASAAGRDANAKLEQRVLAQQLGISTAQTSSIVEKLRRQQLILPTTDEQDRRRQYWQLTSVGHKRTAELVQEITARLKCETESSSADLSQPPPMEGAA